MSYTTLRHTRRSIRLAGFDYAAAGGYFITACTHARRSIFGEIVDGDVVLSAAGRIVQEEWERTASIRPSLEMDAFVVMPNHVHRIVMIAEDSTAVGAHSCAPLQHDGAPPLIRKPRTIGSFVAQFKASTTRRINDMRQTPGAPVWQRNYYEHVIRDDDELEHIREYIVNNPLRWADDEYHV